MAGNWIKVEFATPDKPEIVAMAEILKIDQDAVTGKCLRVWIWADQQSATGNALSVTKSFLNRITFCAGFADALVTVGWLTEQDDGLCLPNFSRHNGKSAKTRAMTAERVAVSRKRNAGSVTKALPDKIRLDKNTIYTLGDDIRIPDRLKTPEVLETVGLWISHVNGSDHGKTIQPNSPQEQSLWEFLTRWNCTADELVKAVHQAITGGWANLREPQPPPKSNGTVHKKPKPRLSI